VFPLSHVGHSMAPKVLDGNVEGMIDMRGAEKTLVPKFEMKETFEYLPHTRNSEVYIFRHYLMTMAVNKTMQCLLIGRNMTKGSERTWKKAEVL